MNDVVAAIASRTHPENAASWDPVGLQLGDADKQVNVVGVCHEVTEGVLDALERDHVELLVTYHPLLFKPTKRVVAGASPGSRAFRLIRNDVSLLVTHTDWDVAPGGAADSLAHLYRMRDVEPFGGDPELGLSPLGRVGDFDMTLAALDAQSADAFGSSGLRVSGDPGRVLKKVAVLPGSGSDFIDAAADVADALVTGDVSHHLAVHAADRGLAIVDPGHIATERPGVRALVKMVSEVIDAEVVDFTRHDPRTWE